MPTLVPCSSVIGRVGRGIWLPGLSHGQQDDIQSVEFILGEVTSAP